MAHTLAVVIVETRAFTARIGDLLSDEEYRRLRVHLLRRPAAGNLIPGTGGLRKIRWSASGRGKRGGARVIYFSHQPSNHLLMLFAFRQERAVGFDGQANDDSPKRR
jgi:mRNA-degrading endonuclease RelE of RelBE toxin-antitoxin system